MAPELPVEGSYYEKDNKIIARYNELLRQSLERERKLTQHYEWRGGKYPPFSIEPMPHARQRLESPGMTAEERVARIQWLKDQRLAPHEPVYIPELMPRNPIRRLFALPWNMLFNTLKPIIGDHAALHGRIIIPRIALYVGLFYAAYYHMKFGVAQWTGLQGWQVWQTRDQTLPGDALWPAGPQKDVFNDKGFKDRKVMHEIKTSWVN